MDYLNQNDILMKWIIILAAKNECSIDDICLQIKRLLPQWDSCGVDEKSQVDNALSKYDCGIIEHEIISADTAINSSLRQVTGSFYTPIKWAEYMVRHSLNIWICDLLSISYENKLYPLEMGVLTNLSTKDTKLLLETLVNAKIVDIACGTGVFLMCAVKEMEGILKFLYLQSAHDKINYNLELETIFNDQHTLSKHVAFNMITGWDINVDALALYILWLIDRYGIISDNILSPVLCVDSLSDEIAQKNGKYDIVIGNPPYLGEKGNKKLFTDLKKTKLGKNYYSGKMDLSYFFVLRALELLKVNGILTYIMTNYFITAEGAKKLREHIKKNACFIEILNLNTSNIFVGAKGQHNIIYTLKKNDVDNSSQKVLIQSCVEGCSDNYLSKINSYYCTNSSLYEENGNIILYSYPEHREIIKAYEKICDSEWGKIFDIKQGIVSGADRLNSRMIDKILGKDYCKKNNLTEGMPIFVFNSDEINKYKIEKKYLKPFYKNSDIKSYNMLSDNCLWIAYINGHDENELRKNCPNLMNHLEKFKSILSLRREVKMGSRLWYELQWNRNKELFEGQKIVVPHRNRYNKFAFVDFEMYASADVYYFKLKKICNGSKIENWYYHLAMANSSIMYMWLYNCGKKKGNTLELYGRALSRVKIPSYKGVLWQKKIVEIVSTIFEKYNLEALLNFDSKIKFNYETEIRTAVDEIIFNALGLDDTKRSFVKAFLCPHL